MIALYRGTSCISRVIRWQTRSVYSHAAWLTPTGEVYESWHVGGVLRNADLLSVHTAGTVVDLYDVQGMTAEQRTVIEDFLDRQVGLKYDFRSVARFLTRRPEAERDRRRWFCSELVFAACLAAGIRLLARTEAYEVSPGLLSRSPVLVSELKV